MPEYGTYTLSMTWQPSEDLEKLNPRSRQLLDEAGYTWDSDLGVFVNRDAGRAISFESVRDRSPEWLAKWLARSV